MSEYAKQDPASIQKMFDSIAKDYDRANAILSFGLHKYWNWKLVKAIASKDQEPYLDLCCGTGDIGFSSLKKNKRPLYFLDFSSQMLDFAKEKAIRLGFSQNDITYLQADAQEIPLAKESVSLATIAYGIRNVKDPIKCFEEVFRVLKKNGRFGILELTQPSNTFLRLGHKLYLQYFLPMAGKLITSNFSAYQYLCNSIQSFVKPQELQQNLIKIGFKEVTLSPLTGGIATLITAKK